MSFLRRLPRYVPIRGITTSTHATTTLLQEAFEPLEGHFDVSQNGTEADSFEIAEVDLEDLEDQTRAEWEQTLESRRRRQFLVDRFSKLGSNQTRENTFQPHHPLHRPVAPQSATLSALIAAGAHLGHSRSLLRPAFLPYAYGTRAGITIIDLDQTLPMLRRAANVTRAVARNKGSILFVGNRPELQPAVMKAIERMGENAYQLSTRWKPGTLTNAAELFGEDTVNHTNHIPDLVVLLNPLDNMVLIKECCHKNVPTVGIIDSNVDPRIVTYAIPANDDSIRTAELIVGMLSLAGKQGLQQKAADEARFASRQDEDRPPSRRWKTPRR